MPCLAAPAPRRPRPHPITTASRGPSSQEPPRRTTVAATRACPRRSRRRGSARPKTVRRARRRRGSARPKTVRRARRRLPTRAPRPRSPARPRSPHTLPPHALPPRAPSTRAPSTHLASESPLLTGSRSGGNTSGMSGPVGDGPRTWHTCKKCRVIFAVKATTKVPKHQPDSCYCGMCVGGGGCQGCASV